MTATDTRRRDFAALHRQGCFVMPNPWDAGSARLLESLGFPALATTSSGHAASLGRDDQHVTRDELLAHAADLAASVSVPVSVDAEHGFGDDPGGVAETVTLLAGTPVAGCSIEDHVPGRGPVLPLTARAENHLYDGGPLEDTVERLRAYRAAGADVVYAPGLSDPSDLERLVAAVEAPVNVLLLPGGPPVAELEALGVRRVSTGGSLAWAAYGALRSAATELRDAGTTGWTARSLTPEERGTAFGGGAARA